MCFLAKNSTLLVGEEMGSTGIYQRSVEENVFVAWLLASCDIIQVWIKVWQLKYFFIFTPTDPWGRWSNLTNIFQTGWFNHQVGFFMATDSRGQLANLCFLWFWTNKTPVFESHKNANVTKMNATCEINNLSSLVGIIGEQLLWIPKVYMKWYAYAVLYYIIIYHRFNK